MDNPLKMLEPTALWQYFFEISQIPHPSGHTERIRQYLIDFGAAHTLETISDAAGNVIIRKPASKGQANRKTVILQAHMDMVPQKNSGIKHDFVNDPLQLVLESNWLRAKNTTLGADNGIGMAAILAILAANDLSHGSIEALFTNDEETGMYGVFGLEQGILKGDIMLNLDSEEEGELFVGCAGGIDADFNFYYKYIPVPKGDVVLKITINGLLGGHSGLDIHLERANANKLLARFLKLSIKEYEARLAYIHGGSLRNAIPREAYAFITIPADMKSEIEDLAIETQDLFIQEYAGVENNIRIICEQVETCEGIFPEVVQDDIVNALFAAPNGVFRHMPLMPEVVETSNNLASIRTEEDRVVVKCLIRSAIESKKYELCSMLDSVFSLAGAKVEFLGGYPGWEPNFQSEILHEMKLLYKRKYDKEPVVKVIHAGLECGIVSALEPHLDIVSFGPTIRFPHSPDEKVSVTSVHRFWDYLLSTLQIIPVK